MPTLPSLRPQATSSDIGTETAHDVSEEIHHFFASARSEDEAVDRGFDQVLARELGDLARRLQEAHAAAVRRDRRPSAMAEVDAPAPVAAPARVPQAPEDGTWPQLMPRLGIGLPKTAMSETTLGQPRRKDPPEDDVPDLSEDFPEAPQRPRPRPMRTKTSQLGADDAAKRRTGAMPRSMSFPDSDLAVALGEATNDQAPQVGDMLRHDTRLQRLIMLPGSRWRVIWDVTGVLFVGYDGFMIPFRQAFYKGEIDPTLAAMMLISTIFWTLDIPMSFLVGYHAVGLIEMRAARIARRYARTWFLPDFAIAVLGWLFIGIGITQDQTASSENSAGLARVARTVRVFRMLRIVRLLRLPKLFRKVREIYARIRSEVLRVAFQMWGSFAVMTILTHFVACGWYAVGSCLWGDIEFCDGSGASWARTFLPDAGYDIMYAYTTSLHWAAAQFTVGSVDVAPQSTRERMCTPC